MEILFNPLTMMLLGLLTHFAVELAEITTSQGKAITPMTYIRQRPYRVFIAVVGALLGYAMLLDSMPAESIKSYMAFGAGYLADSWAKSAANIARNAIGSTRDADS